MGIFTSDNIKLELRKQPYVCNMLFYKVKLGMCERKQVGTFELWCYCRLLKLPLNKNEQQWGLRTQEPQFLLWNHTRKRRNIWTDF